MKRTLISLVKARIPKRHCGFDLQSPTNNASDKGACPLVKVIFLLFACISTTLCLYSCGTPEDENAIDDPITIYSIIKEDTSTGIDVVGSMSNPLGVRKRIFESAIPEKTFEEKRKTFYSILDTLHSLKSCEDQDIYAKVDSLNYLAIHYLKNILLDKKSRTTPLRHKMLNKIASLDKHFSVYYWDENIGVDIPATISVYQYVGTDGALRSFFNLDNTNKEDFNFSTSRIIGIYKLSSANGKWLYLLNFEGCSNNESCFKGSTIAEITDKGLQFNYNSFGEDIEYFFENYANGEKLTLSYNPKTKTLTYKLLTSENKSEQKVFLFDGEMFQVEE